MVSREVGPGRPHWPGADGFIYLFSTSPPINPEGVLQLVERVARTARVIPLGGAPLRAMGGGVPNKNLPGRRGSSLGEPQKSWEPRSSHEGLWSPRGGCPGTPRSPKKAGRVLINPPWDIATKTCETQAQGGGPLRWVTGPTLQSRGPRGGSWNPPRRQQARRGGHPPALGESVQGSGECINP